MNAHTTLTFATIKTALIDMMMKPAAQSKPTARNLSMQPHPHTAAPWTDLSDGFQWALQIEQGAEFMPEAVL